MNFKEYTESGLDEVVSSNIHEDDMLLEMATLRKNVTGLPVNIWVDDCGAYKNSGHSAIIKFQGDTGDSPISRNMLEMTIDGTRIIGDITKTKLKTRDLNKVKEFVNRNRNLLLKLGEAEIDIFQFKELMEK